MSLTEDAPTNSVGSGNIAGTGVNSAESNQGEPGVNPRRKRKLVPFSMFVRKEVEDGKPT